MIKQLLQIFIISILMYLNCYSQASWEKIKTPTDFNLLKVFYLDSMHCWAAGDSGMIIFSSDQGINWEFQNSGVTNYINDIFFLNKDLGWAVAFELEGSDIRSKILSTTNGGILWNIINYRHLNIILTTIFYQDSMNGWIAGEPFELSYTNDGGLNWNSASVDTGSFSNFSINKIKFSTPLYGFAVGGIVDAAGVIWRSNDGGQFWKAYGIAPDKFDDFLFIDSTTALTLTADLERLYPIGVLKFNIPQNFYDYSELNLYGKVTSLARRNTKEIWGTLGCDLNFVVSYDTANTWQFFSTGDSLCISAISFADSLHGIAVGEGGYVFRYLPDNPVYVETRTLEAPIDFWLYQNFPNPFNPSTKISWQNSVGSWQTLKIYDVLGREIETLINEYKEAGNHSALYLVNSALPSGIYFYQLKAGNYVETKKMVLLR